MSLGRSLEGRYRIDALLGHGGMARVYKGVDALLDRGVAIKVLNLSTRDLQDNEDEALLERFDREIRAAARIDHPHAVTIHDAGVLGSTGQPYMVMELLTGQPLDEALAIHGPMDAARALARTKEALGALAVAHQKGVVHKDLKPSNLFLRQAHTPDENLCVVDFGVAHIYQDPQGRLTQTGLLCGTPQYLPPEYASHGEILPAGDVYQMALILIEMLTGQPIVDDTMPLACAIRHTNGDLALPDGLMTTELGPVLTRAIHIDPRQRYHDALAFQGALNKVDPNRLSFSPTPLYAPHPPTRQVNQDQTALCQIPRPPESNPALIAADAETVKENDELVTHIANEDVEIVEFNTIDFKASRIGDFNTDDIELIQVNVDGGELNLIAELLSDDQNHALNANEHSPKEVVDVTTRPGVSPRDFDVSPQPAPQGPLSRAARGARPLSAIASAIAAAATLIAVIIATLVWFFWPAPPPIPDLKPFNEALTQQTRLQVQMAKQHLALGVIKSIRRKSR